jgi:hypothetical protein
MITIVGVFDRFAPAQSAKNELLVFGYSWRQVQLSPDHEVAPRQRTASPHPDDQSLQATMGNLVRGLFGGGAGNRSAHGDLYGSSVRHGDYVLMVDVETEQQRANAEEILRRHGPVDVSHRQT